MVDLEIFQYFSNLNLDSIEIPSNSMKNVTTDFAGQKTIPF